MAAECDSASCPREIQSECAGFVASYGPRIATLVVRVKQGGREVRTASVLIGDERIADRADETELEVDPGMVKVRCVLASGEQREATILVNEGERRKLIEFSFPDDSSSGAGKPLSAASPKGVETERPVPALVWVFGGLTVASATGFAVLGLHGTAREDALADSGCRPFCSQDEVDAIRNEYIVADVLLGVSIASLATGVVLFFARPEVPVSTTFDIRAGENAFRGTPAFTF
jgi:hypothetical protein